MYCLMSALQMNRNTREFIEYAKNLEGELGCGAIAVNDSIHGYCIT